MCHLVAVRLRSYIGRSLSSIFEIPGFVVACDSLISDCIFSCVWWFLLSRQFLAENKIKQTCSENSFISQHRLVLEIFVSRDLGARNQSGSISSMGRRRV